MRGKPIAGPSPERGIVFQHFALYPWKTVRQNILYGLEKQKIPKGEAARSGRPIHRHGWAERDLKRVIRRNCRGA